MTCLHINDATMPQLDDALIGPHAGRWLAETMRYCGRGSVEVRNCRMDRFRYRRGERAIVLYELELRRFTDSAPIECFASASMYRGGKALKVFKRESTTAVKNAACANTGEILYDHERDMLWQLFPRDRHMPHIIDVVEQVSEVKTSLLEPKFGSVSVTSKPVRYRPGVAATLRFTDETQNALYLKLYANTDANGRYARLKRFAHSASHSRCSYSLCAPSARLSRLGVLAFDAAPGLSFEEVVNNAHDDGSDAAIRTANALADLHLSTASPGRSFDENDAIDRARRVTEYLCQLLPERRCKLQRLFVRLQKAMKKFEMRPSHMDMKVDHVFFDKQVHFIDLDSAALSDPVYDVAMLVARLDAAILVDPSSSERYSSIRDGFKQAYFHRVPRRWCDNYGTHYARASLKVALFFMQHLAPDWRSNIDWFIDRAWRMAGRGVE